MGRGAMGNSTSSSGRDGEAVRAFNELTLTPAAVMAGGGSGGDWEQLESITMTPQSVIGPLRNPQADAQRDMSDPANIHSSLVPTVMTWGHGGTQVFIEGSFDGWSTKQEMHRTGNDFTAVKMLPPGRYQYKFIVDGEWRYSPDHARAYDDHGNINNEVVVVDTQMPDDGEGSLKLYGAFEAPPSPPSSYTSQMPGPEDYAKEPPAAPPHLHLSLLNVPTVAPESVSLPRPQHVILNHVYYEQRASYPGAHGGAPQGNSSAASLDSGSFGPIGVLGSTVRYRSKYVTTCWYAGSTI